MPPSALSRGSAVLAASVAASALVPSAAWSGPAQDIAAEFPKSGPPPAFGLACAPIREAVNFAEALGSFSKGLDRPELQMLLDAAGDPSVTEVDGIDVDGGFAMVAGPGGATAILPMKGDIHRAVELFMKESEDASAWTISETSAYRTDPDGTVRTLSVDGERARMTIGPLNVRTSTQATRPPDALLQLPDAPGCALWVEPPDTGKGPAALRNPLALWLPFSDSEPVELNVQLPAHRDRAEKKALVAPLPVVGPKKPQAVVTLGVPVLSILRDPVVLDSMPPEVRDKLPDPGFADNVGAGLVIGTFLGPSGPSIVAVMPVEKANGRPVSKRRIWKVASDAAVQAQEGRRAPPPERIGRRALQVQVTPRHSIVLQAERGRVYAGNVRSDVESVARGEGESWLTPEQAHWAETHAFSLFADAPLPGMATPIHVQVGAGTNGDIFGLQLLMDPGLQDPRVAAALRALNSARKSRKSGGAMPMP